MHEDIWSTAEIFAAVSTWMTSAVRVAKPRDSCVTASLEPSRAVRRLKAPSSRSGLIPDLEEDGIGAGSPSAKAQYLASAPALAEEGRTRLTLLDSPDLEEGQSPTVDGQRSRCRITRYSIESPAIGNIGVDLAGSAQVLLLHLASP